MVSCFCHAWTEVFQALLKNANKITHRLDAALSQVHLQCQGLPSETWESWPKFIVSLSALWLQCMLEDVVLMGCTSILKKEGWLHFIQIGFSLLPPGSLLTLSRFSGLRATEVLRVPCGSTEAGAQLLHSKSCLIPH